MNTLFHWYQLFVVIVCFQLLFFVISCYYYVDKVVLDWWVNHLDGEITSFNLTYKGPNISHWLTGPKPHIHQTPLLPKIISFFISCYLLFSRLFIFVEITTNNNAKQHNNNVEQQIPTDNTHKSLTQDSKINIQVVNHSLRSIIT